MTYSFKKLLLLFLFLQATDVFAQKSGVLIMAHGGSEEWNEYVKETAQPLAEDYEITFAWGMANPVTLHQGIQELEAKGVTKIIAVPLFISSYSPIIRQTEYLFGKRDTLADSPMPLMHHSDQYVKMFNAEVDSSDYRYGMLFPPSLAPLAIQADVVMTDALDSHDAVADILRKRILELSENPAKETILLAAHGPNSEADNTQWIKTMEELILKIQKIQANETGSEFRQIFGVTVRDDAPTPIFNQAKQQLRTLVRQAGLNGEVMVIPLFLSSGGREKAIAKRLEGLDFKWSGNTLLPDTLLSDFLINSVEKANRD